MKTGHEEGAHKMRFLSGHPLWMAPIAFCKIRSQWVEERSATKSRVKYYLLDEMVQAN